MSCRIWFSRAWCPQVRAPLLGANLGGSYFTSGGCPIDKSEGVVKDRGFLCDAMSTAASPEG